MKQARYPANIEKTYIEYEVENDPVRKLSLLFDTFGQIIRFWGCVFLSDYLYSDQVNETVNRSIVGLTRPSLGSWMGFIREYTKYMINTGSDFFLFDFSDAFISIAEDTKYEKQYSGRFRNKNVKQGNAFDEIIMLRNAIAHGAMSPTQEEAGDAVSIYDQYIKRILDRFSPLFSNYLIAKAEEVNVGFTVVRVSFNLINYSERIHEDYQVEYSGLEDYYGHDIRDYVQDNGMYLLSMRDNRILRLAEYLVEIMDDTEHEDYYLYDGYGNKNVTYIGMKYKRQIECYLDSIKMKFAEKGTTTKWNRRFFDYESFRDHMNDMTAALISIHRHSGKYNSGVYVKRECDHLCEDFLSSDKTTLIVTAEAGVGKTNFLCFTAEKLIKDSIPVYFLNGRDLTDSGAHSLIFDQLRADYLDAVDFHSMQDFLNLLDKTEDRRFVMIVDAINEAYDSLEVLQEIDALTSLGDRYPWLKIIASVRTVSFRILENRIKDEYGKKMPLFTLRDRYYSVKKDNRLQYTISIEEWNILQVIEAFDKYRRQAKIVEGTVSYHQLERELQEILRNPLNMGLYFHAQVTDPEINIHTEEELFLTMETAWNENDDISESMLTVQSAIVSEMRKTRQNMIDSDSIHDLDEQFRKRTKDIRIVLLSPLERLKDTGIIIEKQESGLFVIAFVYQKYLEYLLLRQLKQEKNELDKVIRLLLQSREWNRLPEMYMACLQYLKQLNEPERVSGLIVSAVGESGIAIAGFETALIEIWYTAALQGKEDEIARFVIQNGLYSLGMQLIRKLDNSEESDAAFHLIDKLIHEDAPNKEELHFLRGLYYMKVSEYDTAENDFLLCADSRNYELSCNAKVQLAKNCRKAGDVFRAKSILEEYLRNTERETPYYADALIQLGLCFYSDKEYQSALDEYLKALSISEEQNDHYVTLYNELGISTVRAELGQIEECERILLDVYRLAGKHGYIDLLSDALNGLSANFVRKNEYEKAIDYAKQGLLIWRHSHYYSGQIKMCCTIISAMIGLGKNVEAISPYKDEADRIVPLIKEKVMLAIYEKTMNAYDAYLGNLT